MMYSASQLLEKAVGEFAKLPGIGRKTAMRLVLHLLKQERSTVEAFGNAITTNKHIRHASNATCVKMFYI